MAVKVSKEIKPLHFLIASVTLICLIGSGFFFVGREMGNMEAEASAMNKRMTTVEAFKEKGDRFTKQDGTRLETEMTALEKKVEALPADWFKDQFNELKGHVVTLTTAMNNLEIAVTMVRFQYEQIAKRLDLEDMRDHEFIDPTKR